MVWINLNQSGQQISISLQSIHQSRKLIKQMKRDLDELEGMADKTSMLVSCFILFTYFLNTDHTQKASIND
jgi:hypothetical protein